MDIGVYVRAAENLAQAGTRIRYQRLAASLQSIGHRLHLEPLDGLRSPAQVSHDVVLLSKCHDPRALLLAHLLAGSGKLIGIDLFDDVFSQRDDSRLLPERAWLRSMAAAVDFALVSTERLRRMAAVELPGVPVHVLADPAAPADADTQRRTLATALQRAHAARCIDVAWFGMGDNPHFDVGLHDLHAFSSGLAALRRDGWQPRLRVLTNRRAMTPVALEKLARLPLTWTLDEWSDEAEAQLLADSVVAFLPVRASAFSAAKSLNRAVTALSSGCQVLSAGHALYAPLDPFVYRDPVEFVRDLDASRLRLRGETLDALRTALDRHAGVAHEAQALDAFLKSRRAAPRRSPRPRDTIAVLHGVRSEKVVHEFAQRSRQLSVGGPYANPGLNYDLRFVEQAGALHAQLGEAGVARLKPEHQRALVAATSPTGQPVQTLCVERLAPDAARSMRQALGERLRVERLARYAEATAATAALVQVLLQGVRPLVSEAEPPYSADLQLEAAP